MSLNKSYLSIAPGFGLSSSIAYQSSDGHDFLVPETIPECQQRCREAQQEI